MTAIPHEGRGLCSFGTGDKVFLKACRAGEPGTVIRAERGKMVVYWRDMDYWSRHRPESLEPADEKGNDNAK